MNCTVREMRAGLLYKMGMTKTAEDLRYPIGRFRAVMPVTSELRAAAIDAIAGLPDRMRAAVADLTDDQLDTPYRPEGWTVRQVVHHVADSHMNGADSRQARADGRNADDQAVRRKRLGAAGRHEAADRACHWD